MVQRDSNLDHAAVKLYRDLCHITPNHVQRREIIVTFDWAKGVLGSPLRAADHWEATLRKFMLEGCNPKRVDWAMDRYEERVRKTT